VGELFKRREKKGWFVFILVLDVSIIGYLYVRLWWMWMVVLSLLCLGAQTTSLRQPNDPKVFYIRVDDRFTTIQRKYIKEAADHWVHCSEGKVSITLSFNHHIAGAWKDSIPMASAITMWMIPLSEKQLGKEKYLQSFRDVAEVVPRERGSVDMIVYDHLQRHDFTMVMMHEFGHLFGLTHTDKPNRLMFPSVDGQRACIDTELAEEFCQQYNCKGMGDCDPLDHLSLTPKKFSISK
jgi:hypothetical protein